MNQTRKTFRILLAQTSSSNTHAKNIATLAELCAEAENNQCHMLCLPEVSGLMNQDVTSAQAMICEEQADPYLAACRELAAAHSIWIHNGSTPVIGSTGLAANRTHLVNNNGELIASYDKIHLFDIYLPDGKDRLESKRYGAGNKAVVVNTPWGRMGLSICYDLRFPTLYRDYAKAGAKLIFVPSAFIRTTGKAHWEVLLRARAIENACYIVAAAQTGKHDDGRHSYGHSMVIDPWGNVLADLDKAVTTAVVDIELDKSDLIRSQIPSLEHSRAYELKIQ